MKGEQIASESTASANLSQEVVAPEVVHQHYQHSSYSGDLWLHGIFLAMAFGVIAMSFLMTTDGRTDVFLPGFSNAMPETCTSKRILGIDCPGCGMTRAFISISHGQFNRAWELNRASFVVYAFVFVQIPWHIMQLLRIKLGKGVLNVPWVCYLPILVAVSLVINWILRFV